MAMQHGITAMTTQSTQSAEDQPSLKLAQQQAGFQLGGSIVITGTVSRHLIRHNNKKNKQHASPTAYHVADDASMGEWMAYVYQQKPLPTNF